MSYDNKVSFSFNEEMVRKALSEIAQGRLFEIRFLQGKNWSASGYFTDVEKAISELKKVRVRTGANCYVILNEINPDCYFREQHDTFKEGVSNTGDSDIINYRYFFVDVDPVRKSGISSSAGELSDALTVSNDLANAMHDVFGWSYPTIKGLSGNGFHNLWSTVPIPATAENKDIFKNVINYLHDHHGTDKQDIDVSVFNPARICKLYGTVAHKGTDSKERPHRESKIIRVDHDQPLLTLEQLKLVSDKYIEEQNTDKAKATPSTGTKKATQASVIPAAVEKKFSLEDFLTQHNIDNEFQGTTNGWNMYRVTCPWQDEHTVDDRQTFVFQDNNSGMLGFQCHHSHCQNRKWHDYRLFYEPDYQNKKPSGKTSTKDKKETDTPSNRITIPSLSAELDARHIFVRLNLITQEIDVTSPDPMTFKSLVIRLHSELTNIYKGVTFDVLTNYLSEIATMNQYNPVLEYISAIQYDGHDYLEDLYKLMGIDGTEDDHDAWLSQILVHKWLYQGMALLHNDDFAPIAPDGVLTLQGEQGCGKTSLIEHLAIKNEWFKRGASIDPKDKDTIRRACTNFIVELGEVETTLKSDIENLKNFITNSVDEYRVAYGHFDVRHARRSSLSATCNSDRYLIDPTGNRRWWTVKLTKFMPYEEIQKLNTEQLWSQIYHEYQKNGVSWFRLTSWEMQALSIRNNEFEKMMKAEPEIMDIFAQVDDTPDLYTTVSITASKWKEQFNSLHGFSIDQIGKALHKLGYDATQKRVNGSKARFYELPVLKTSVKYIK